MQSEGKEISSSFLNLSKINVISAAKSLSLIGIYRKILRILVFIISIDFSGKSVWDSMNNLLSTDQESAGNMADNEAQSDISLVSNFLSETLSAILGRIADFRGHVFPVL